MLLALGDPREPDWNPGNKCKAPACFPQCAHTAEGHRFEAGPRDKINSKRCSRVGKNTFVQHVLVLLVSDGVQTKSISHRKSVYKT